MAKYLVWCQPLNTQEKKCDKGVCHCCIFTLDCHITGLSSLSSWGNPTVNASKRKGNVEIEWCFYTPSFSHNVSLTEALHLKIFYHGLISIEIIVRVNLTCHWIIFVLYCINQPWKHIQDTWAPIWFFKKIYTDSISTYIWQSCSLSAWINSALV